MIDLKAALKAVLPASRSWRQCARALELSGPDGIPPTLEVTGLAYNSRQVRPGDLFVALRGERVDGHAYLQDAWERGARAAVIEVPVSAVPLPVAQVQDGRRALSQLSSVLFDAPSREVCCIGITGTKGKTSTSYFLKHLLQSGDLPTGVIGTLGLHLQETTLPWPLTTPESFDLQRMLALLRRLDCTHAAMEVSAHGIHFQRTRDILFQRGIFTNLGQDHLDFFESMEHYGVTKQRFFEEQIVPVEGALAIVNIDDAWGQRIASAMPSDKVLTYGNTDTAQIRGTLRGSRTDGLHFEVRLPDGEQIEALVPLGGAFFVQNLLAAVATASSLGVSTEAIAIGLTTMPAVPGRHEVISTRHDDITVVVDYAHTPQSVSAILATVERGGSHPVIALVGCGGDRDRTKRPQMGRLAYEASDHLLITSDNPRSEAPEAIIAEILEGIPADAAEERIAVEIDRSKAIAEAIRDAEPGSVIFILGKGHEPYQILRDKTIEFDDREHARAALATRRAISAGVQS